MSGHKQWDSFIWALAELGCSASNARLRAELGCAEGNYEETKIQLIEAGLIVAGRGCGGSVALGESITDQLDIVGDSRCTPDASSEAAEASPKTPSDKPAKGKKRAAQDAARNGGDLGFEAELFRAADKLCGNVKPSDYKHVALGLIFLKYISDAFEAKHNALLADDAQAAKDLNGYLTEKVFWALMAARWAHLMANARQPIRSDSSLV